MKLVSTTKNWACSRNAIVGETSKNQIYWITRDLLHVKHMHDIHTGLIPHNI